MYRFGLFVSDMAEIGPEAVGLLMEHKLKKADVGGGCSLAACKTLMILVVVKFSEFKS